MRPSAESESKGKIGRYCLKSDNPFIKIRGNPFNFAHNNTGSMELEKNECMQKTALNHSFLTKNHLSMHYRIFYSSKHFLEILWTVIISKE